MFLRYQKLYITDVDTPVYYLAHYINNECTIIICEVISSKKIIHTKATEIVGIIDGVN